MTAETFDSAAVAAAAELHRLRDARVGADRTNAGKYAVYFFDDEGNEIRAAGGFGSVDDAAAGAYVLVAESMLEAVACAGVSES